MQNGDPSTEAKLLTRRIFIRTRFQTEGKISESTMRSWLSNRGQEYSLKAMRGDIDFIQKFESKVIFEHEIFKDSKKEIEWIDDSRKLGATREERMGHNREAKLQIGEVLSSLVLGLKQFQFVIRETNEIRRIERLERILDALKESLKPKTDPTNLLGRLEHFWADSQRALFLDAGTTTQYFAQNFLQYFSLPMNGLEQPNKLRSDVEDTPINKIEAITNDRHIFYCLGEQRVNTKTIMVGGRQQYRSAAVSGRMAERFLKFNDLWAGMGIVGISAVCLPERRGVSEYFYAENENVAAMKLLFLERSKIRIIIADSSKFKSTGEQGDTRICEINKNQVDLVVTERASPETKTYFQERGVPLICCDCV